MDFKGFTSKLVSSLNLIQVFIWFYYLQVNKSLEKEFFFFPFSNFETYNNGF